jgi:hypothetical protein
MPFQLHLNGSVFIMTSLIIDVIGAREQRPRLANRVLRPLRYFFHFTRAIERMRYSSECVEVDAFLD